MVDLDRETLAYALLSLLAVVAVISAAVWQRKRYWHRLRQAGHSSAKQRELRRRR